MIQCTVDGKIASQYLQDRGEGRGRKSETRIFILSQSPKVDVNVDISRAHCVQTYIMYFNPLRQQNL